MTKENQSPRAEAAVEASVSSHATQEFQFSIFREGELFIAPKIKLKKDLQSKKRIQKFCISAIIKQASNTLVVSYGISLCSHHDHYNFSVGRAEAINRRIILNKVLGKETAEVGENLLLKSENLFAFEKVEKYFDIIAKKIYEERCVKEFFNKYTVK
jgi:formylmethanofuran dehydrogenase subunit E